MNVADFDETADEFVKHRDRLLLWFDDNSDVVKSFDGVFASTVVKWRLGVPAAGEDEAAKEARERELETATTEFEDARTAYLSAARAYLAGDSVTPM